MEYSKLIEIDTPVSRIALGGCPLGGHGWGEVDDKNSIAAVHAALDCGINFFDTADIYGFGHSENLLARALGNKNSRNLVIATKYGVRRTSTGKIIKDISDVWLEEALHGSLKRLKIDCIDLYYIHWPDSKTPIEEAVEALDRYRRAGKIKAIGLSNVTPTEYIRAKNICPISAVQVQYSLVDRGEAEALLASTNLDKVPLITWGSLAQGLLTGKYDQGSVFESDDRRNRYINFSGEKFQKNLEVVNLLKRFSSTLNKTPSQIAMNWLLMQQGVGSVLFGAKSKQQVCENIGCVGWEMPALLLKKLNDSFKYFGLDASEEMAA